MKPCRAKLTPLFRVALYLVFLTALRLKAEAGLEVKPLPPLPAAVKALRSDGLQNLFSLSTNLYSGSAPEGDLGFASLNQLGIKTIITVDGSAPDVSAAHRHGLRYVHLPHGYDGIDAQTQALLIKAVETVKGPVYVHCHHGQHRGPAAVAVLCLAELSWSPAQAEAWMVVAGTAPNYAGLYAVPRTFRRPSTHELNGLPAEFPEIAKVSGLTEGMVAVDQRWDLLKAVRAAGYQSPPDHPDVVPANEAGLLREHFRELQRSPEAIQHGSQMLEALGRAERQTEAVEVLLRSYLEAPTATSRATLDRTFDLLGQSCVSCHHEFRDPAGIKFRRR